VQAKLTRDGDPVQLKVESPAVKKRVSWESAAVKIRLYVCWSYSETVIITILKSFVRIQVA
jgi:hypothetical protein